VAAVWSLASVDPQNMQHRERVLSFYPPSGARRMFGLTLDSLLVSTCGVTQHPQERMTIHRVATQPFGCAQIAASD